MGNQNCHVDITFHGNFRWLARFRIAKHPFKAMGPLVSSAVDIIDIQGLAHQSTFWVGKGPLGPFSSSVEGSQAILESYLAMIASGEIDSCCPIDTYLVHRFCQVIVGALWEDVPSGDQFFLKHPDDKGDHILHPANIGRSF